MTKRIDCHAPLAMTARNSAFTLIELLVVVLIIGILAAVALPQYQRAIDRSRNAELLLNIRAVWNAQQQYKLINGGYTKDFTQLDIDIPNTIYIPYHTPNAILTKPERFQILIDGSGDSIVGLPIKASKCQDGNSFSPVNNSCYLLFMYYSKNGVITCKNGTRTPVLPSMSCEALGFKAE